MALYEPTQRVDFLYIGDHNAIYVKATVTVPLDVNEYIPTPPLADISFNKHGIGIKLRAISVPSEQGRYSQTMPVLVKILDTDFDGIPEKNLVATTIGITPPAPTIYTVTTTVYKDGEIGGSVTTTSENADIEIL